MIHRKGHRALTFELRHTFFFTNWRGRDALGLPLVLMWPHRRLVTCSKAPFRPHHTQPGSATDHHGADHLSYADHGSSRRHRVRSTQRSILYSISCIHRDCVLLGLVGTPLARVATYEGLLICSLVPPACAHLSLLFTFFFPVTSLSTPISPLYNISHHASLNCSPSGCPHHTSPCSTRRLLSRAATGSSAAKLQYHAHCPNLVPLHPHPPSCLRHKTESLYFRDIDNDRCERNHVPAGDFCRPTLPLRTFCLSFGRLNAVTSTTPRPLCLPRAVELPRLSPSPSGRPPRRHARFPSS